MSATVSRQAVRSVAKRYGIRPDIFERLIGAESNFSKTVRSPAGAIGPGQLMPATARSLGVDPNDPAQNLDGSARYLRDQLRRFKGDYKLALAAYNAGPGAVEEHGGVPPYAETQNYVKKILGGTNVTADPDEQRSMSSDYEPSDPVAPELALDALMDPGADALDVVLAQRANDDAAAAASPLESASRQEGGKAPLVRAGAVRGRQVREVGQQVDSLLQSFGAPLGSGVRDPGENARAGGAEDSDHLPGDDRYARDVPYDLTNRQERRKAYAVARKVAKRLGAEFREGAETTSTVKLGRKTYRVQIIAGTPDHMDHVHFGIRAVG